MVTDRLRLIVGKVKMTGGDVPSDNIKKLNILAKKF